MTLRSLLVGFALVAGVMAVPPRADAASHHLILSGSGGQPEYTARFHEWANRLQTVLARHAGPNAGRIEVLAEQSEEGPLFVPIDRESIREAFVSFRKTVTTEDEFFIYFIGHGSYLKNTAKFHIPGEDITADEIKSLIESVPARRHIIINSTSSSAAFINVLSAPDRVICTATRSVDEWNATEFMEFFLRGLEDGSADRNRDNRISVLEACQQAAELTAGWYTVQGLIATEHTLIDDNGDGLGSRLPLPMDLALAMPGADPDTPPVFDGALADLVFLKDFIFPESVPRELISAYTAAIERIVSLKRNKATMSPAQYYSELEPLLIEAAKINREIRVHSDPNED